MEAAQPLVTVICPFFDVAPFLDAAVKSVLGQDYEHIELLLVDDGSVDGSTEIALGWAARHQGKIRYLAHEGRRNRGVSASRNLGRRAARGSLIASLDADDVWLPGTLQSRVKELQSHPQAGMSIAATQYWYSWTGQPQDADRDVVVQVGVPGDRLHRPPYLLTQLYPLGPGAAPSMNTVLVRADVLQQIGGWEDRFPGAYEDQAMLVKAYLSTPVLVSTLCCDRYRIRSGSVMAKVYDAKGYDAARVTFLTWLDRYLRETGTLDRHVRDLLAQARRPYRWRRARRVRRTAWRWARALLARSRRDGRSS